MRPQHKLRNVARLETPAKLVHRASMRPQHKLRNVWFLSQFTAGDPRASMRPQHKLRNVDIGSSIIALGSYCFNEAAA